MKYFFRRKIPRGDDVLLIESGSRDVALRAISNIRNIFPGARYHLCTCLPNSPADQFASVHRAADYPGAWSKLKLLFSFRGYSSPVLVMLCTGEPILLKWKVLAALLIPAKILIVNEHADFFWFDISNRRTIRRLLSIRSGVNLEELLFTLLRGLAFPLTLLYLAIFAGFMYLRRWRRLLLWKIQGDAQ
jgi:hypothetical protein